MINIEKLIEEYKTNDITIKQLALNNGITHSYLEYHFKKHKVKVIRRSIPNKRKGLSSKFSEEKEIYLIDRHFKENIPIYQIAKEENVCRRTIQSIIKKHGLKGIWSYKKKRRINKTYNKSYNRIYNRTFCYEYPNLFQTIDSEEKAYWLGFLYADGYVGRNNRIEISLKLSDKEHLEKFSKFMCSDKKIATDHFRCRFQASHHLLKQDLIKLGCVNKKSLILTFPTEEQVPKELLTHFIRGYFDGDGCINNPIKNSFGCSVLGTKNMLEGIINFFNLDTIVIKKDKRTNSNCFFFNLYGGNSRQFLTTLYKNSSINLTRKYYRYLINIACYNRNIVMKGGKISEVHQDKLDNTERLALDYLLKMQTLQSIGIEQISKIHSQESPQSKQIML